MVRSSVARRVFVAVLLMVAAVAAAILGLTRLSLGHGFSEYVNRVELAGTEPIAVALEASYARDGWTSVRRLGLPEWVRINVPPPSPPPGSPPAGPRLALERRLALLDRGGGVVTGSPKAARSPFRRDLRGAEGLIGYLALEPVASADTQLDRAFLAEQARHFWLIGGLALLLAALSALIAAKALRDPVNRLVEGTRRLSRGEFDTRIEIDRQDELGELAGDFNRLAGALERHEASRRQWAADTSHELRTPIAVLRAELEALLDGVRQPDRRTLEALHGQVLSLAKLVDDLSELTRADVGQLQYSMTLVDPGGILLEVARAYTKRFAEAGLSVLMPRTTHMATVQGDAERLRQLFVNLLENTLRYTDPGGKVELEVLRSGREVVIRLEDSPPGVPDEALSHLFDRFYRVESSRSRGKGGSGLGLALCRKIVEAHGGTITAGPSRLGGLALEVRLPQKGMSL